MRRLGFRPRKKLGQNFLADEEILERIADAAEIEEGDEVLEVGPGLGTLTAVLAARAGRVTAVELDTELAEIVRSELAGRPNLEVINQDILKFDLCARYRPRGYKMVGNLPYYVTSPILRYFLESPCPPSQMVMMLQKEVADRLLARPGDMSLLTVSVLLYGEPHLVRYVEAHAFYPAPKVDSAILRIDVRPRPAVDVEPELFFTLAAAGFSQRRKQLHNALSQRFWMHAGQAPDLLREAGIDPMRRAETLSMEDWGALYQVFLRAGILKQQPPPPEDEPTP
ncbi:MAG: 16S rRNA (adenine(1518)-N(6)/adenine(1519)-N(6))-dimethyltransferase RsmA [Chloroflexota bacterium]